MMKMTKAAVYFLLLALVLFGGAAYIYIFMGHVFRNVLKGFM